MASVTKKRKENGRWEVRWREPGGRRRGRTFDRSGDADAFATVTRRQLQLGGLVQLDDDDPVTLAQYVEVWWRRHALPHLAPNTRKNYGQAWEKHVRRKLGATLLRHLDTSDLDDFTVQLLDDDVGVPTVLMALAMLQSVMACAVRDSDHPTIVVNPVAGVRKPKQTRRQARPIWPTTVESIRRAVSPRDATLVTVMAYAGLRPEEALALQWGDISSSHIRVERAVALGEIREDDRIKRHDRSVKLLGPASQDLAEWRIACGRPGAMQLVFPRPDGQLWKDTDWRNWRRRRYRPAAKAAGLTTLRPYALRGSFASLLIQEGKKVTYVADQLGHTPETCLRYYARLFEEAPDVPIAAEDAIRAARRDPAQEVLAV